MITVLEQPEIRRRAMPISVRTYHWMQRQGLVAPRAELIRGVIVEKMSKSPKHTSLTRRITRLLRQFAGSRYFVMKEDPLTLSDSEPEPDVAVVAGQEEDYDEQHPATALLAVEVSVSSESGDREMLSIYAGAGVAEVWLVLSAKQQVERYTSPIGGSYAECRVFSAPETLTSAALPGFALPLAELF